MKKHLLIISIFLSVNSYAQNKSYSLFLDSINPIAEKDYEQSKQLYLKYEKVYKYDPFDVKHYLEYALINQDLDFFKKEILKIIKNYGFRYSYADTSLIKFDDSFYEQIYINNLHHWLEKKSRKYYSKWLAKHPLAIENEKLVSHMMAKDQLVRGVTNFHLGRFMKRMIKDSVSYNEFIEASDRIYKNIDLV